jgi:hypothetical protein
VSFCELRIFMDVDNFQSIIVAQMRVAKPRQVAQGAQ